MPEYKCGCGGSGRFKNLDEANKKLKHNPQCEWSDVRIVLSEAQEEMLRRMKDSR
jgi:hypothetical protein